MTYPKGNLVLTSMTDHELSDYLRKHYALSNTGCYQIGKANVWLDPDGYPVAVAIYYEGTKRSIYTLQGQANG